MMSTDLLKSRGFSIVELMVVIAIVGIMVARGIPAMADSIAESRVNNIIFTISRDLLYARNQAINLQSNVTMCPFQENARGDLSCGADWNDGYLVFIDDNGNGDFDADRDIEIAIRNDLIETGTLFVSGAIQTVSYQPDGGLVNEPADTISFEYCPNVQNPDDFSRAVFIGISGRSRTSSDIDNDGIDEDSTGAIISVIDCV